ncbi:hypothetical protein GGS26DRAFT_567328 [Hypomontagnella submonticulosa]|nr:hypothetical protein GGS26DRAFT_567328 [Hypomontagnella submonticulosa]
MQTSFTSVVLAVAAILPITMARLLPANNQPYICNTQGDSAGVSNIREGCNKLARMDQQCAAGKKGKEVRMIKGDGYAFYIGSLDGEPQGSFPCKELVKPFIYLAEECGGEVNGDYRGGGVAWVPGYEGRTYVYATK